MVDIQHAIKTRNKLMLKKIEISDRVRALRSIDKSKLSPLQQGALDIDIQLGLDQMAECQKDIEMFQKNIDAQMEELE